MPTLTCTYEGLYNERGDLVVKALPLTDAEVENASREFARQIDEEILRIITEETRDG